MGWHAEEGKETGYTKWVPQKFKPGTTKKIILIPTDY